MVFQAQKEAIQAGMERVFSEHILLALVHDEESVAARVLIRLGASLEAIRTDVKKLKFTGNARKNQQITLDPGAKRVIDLAYEEARNLNVDYIGTGQLLLGLIRERDELADDLLAKFGIDLERARREVIYFQAL